MEHSRLKKKKFALLILVRKHGEELHLVSRRQLSQRVRKAKIEDLNWMLVSLALNLLETLWARSYGTAT